MAGRWRPGGYNTGGIKTFRRDSQSLSQRPNSSAMPMPSGPISAPTITSRKLIPPAPIVPGGVTDKLLLDYPNLFADTSANSANNALSRDAEFTKGFLARHQDKLHFGSDCNCDDGKGGGVMTRATTRRHREWPGSVWRARRSSLLKRIDVQAGPSFRSWPGGMRTGRLPDRRRTGAPAGRRARLPVASRRPRFRLRLFLRCFA